MKQLITRKLLIAGVALMTVSSVMAQDQPERPERPERPEKPEKGKKGYQQITIIRNPVTTGGKTTVEIDGDHVKIDGKDVKDMKGEKGVSVTVRNVQEGTYYPTYPGKANTWSYSTNGDGDVTLFSEDKNRAMLGVVTEEDDKGAGIQAVTKNSGADKAGLKQGDVITQIAGHKIENTEDVTNEVRAHKPGDKVDVTYLRDGKEQKVTAELGKWKGIDINTMVTSRATAPTIRYRDMTGNNAYGIFNGQGYVFNDRPHLGLSIQDTDDGIGAKVLDVDDDSNAAKAGIKENDVIVGIDDHEVRGVDDISRIMRDNKEKYTFSFRIKRDGKTQNVEVKMPRKLKTTDL